MKETLRRYRVIEARDGDEALVLAREAAPDLLILDWMMPGRHGPAVLAELRADPVMRELPILMMTARAGAAERAQLLAAGATACMAKPFGTGTGEKMIRWIASIWALKSPPRTLLPEGKKP